MKDFKLLDLLEDKEYQKEYTQEERYELFNKYQIKTIEPFFMPIHYFVAYLLHLMGAGSEDMRYGYGHGQYILNTKLKEKALESCILGKKEDGTSNYGAGYRESPSHEYLIFVPVTYRGNLRVRFWLKQDTSIPFQERLGVVVDGKSVKIRPPRENVYEKLEEWLKDFKFI